MIPKLWELIDYTINTVGKLSVPVIWSYQNSARINKPYITLDYSSDDLPDFEWLDNHIDANGFRWMASWRKAVVDLQVYADGNSLQIANRLSMLLATEASLDQQQRLDVSIGNRLFLARVPALLNNSQYEDRAIYHFDFYYTESFHEEVGLIETVIIDGTYSGSLTEVTCHEIVSIAPQTFWDNDDTTWDDISTVWDGSTVTRPNK